MTTPPGEQQLHSLVTSVDRSIKSARLVLTAAEKPLPPKMAGRKILVLRHNAHYLCLTPPRFPTLPHLYSWAKEGKRRKRSKRHWKARNDDDDIRAFSPSSFPSPFSSLPPLLSRRCLYFVDANFPTVVPRFLFSITILICVACFSLQWRER